MGPVPETFRKVPRFGLGKLPAPVAAAAFLVVIVVAPLIFRLSGETLTNRGVAPVLVEGTIKGTTAFAVERIDKMLAGTNKPSLPKKFQLFQLVPVSDPLFPSFLQLQQASRVDPNLQLYLSKYKVIHQNDFYFFDPVGDAYWETKDSFGQVIKEFRSGFLIHLEQRGTSLSAISVFEFLPVMRKGKLFQLGHHGPGMYWNIVPTNATFTDRVELLSIVTNSSPLELK
jgi:hypothetical protein